jgi:hypothetical protein
LKNYEHSFSFSGCDINSPRQAGLKGETPDICKTLESPLHLGIIYAKISFVILLFNSLASQWGLDRVVSTLIEHHAEINLFIYLNNQFFEFVGCRS